MADEGRPCPSISGPQGCNFVDLALAASAEHLVFVAINGLGCGRGQVRIGLGDPGEDPFTVWLGGTASSDESNLEFGVDPDFDGELLGCTGASRAADPAGGGPPLGASHPAVAALDLRPGKAGALAAWLTNPADESASVLNDCSAALEVEVEALVVGIPAGERGWLNAAGGGIPVSLGRTHRLFRPAVLALPSLANGGGYAVAFAGEEDGSRGVKLLSVRSTDSGPTLETSDFVGDPDAGQVALAADTGSAEPAVGVAWGSGCGEDSSVKFTVVPELGAAAASSETLTITAPHLISGPELTYLTGGFSTEEPRGGWFVLWVEAAPGGAAQMRLARVAAASLEVLDELALPASAAGLPLLQEATGGADQAAALVHSIVGRSERPSMMETLGAWCEPAN
jgi:hypothetical protein